MPNDPHPIRRGRKAVYVVEDFAPPKRSKWTRVGTAWENSDGSWNIRLSALPAAGNRLHMREPPEDEVAAVAAAIANQEKQAPSPSPSAANSNRERGNGVAA